MKKLVLSFVFLFSLIALLGFTENLVEAGEPTSETTVSYTYSFNVDGVGEVGGTVNELDYGQTLTVDSATHSYSGKDYVGFVENKKVQPTLNSARSIKLTENTDLTFIYKTSGATVVVLMDANQELIGVRVTDSSNLISDIPDLNSFSKPGLTTDGWTINGTDVIETLSTTEFTEDVIVYIKYSDPVIEDLTLNILDGGKITGTELTTDSFTFNEIVSVTANTPGEGFSFLYWLKDGRIASYDQTYVFTMAKNHNLTAKYIETASLPTIPEIFISIDKVYNIESGLETLLGQFSLPEGEELVEYGVIHADETSEPNITLATTGVTKERVNKYNPNTKEFVISFNNDDLGDNYRAYVITRNSTTGNITTTYSPIEFTKIWFYNTNEWPTVHAFSKYFEGSTEINDLGGWPGTEAYHDGTSNWYYVYVPLNAEVQPFTIIFNGDSEQTMDINVNSNTDIYFAMKTTYSGETSLYQYVTYNEKVDFTTTRVYFNLPEWLGELKIHILNGTLNDNAWRGADMVQVNDTSWYYYDILTATDDFNIIISGTQNSVVKESFTYTVNSSDSSLYLEIGTWGSGSDSNKFHFNVFESVPEGLE